MNLWHWRRKLHCYFARAAKISSVANYGIVIVSLWSAQSHRHLVPMRISFAFNFKYLRLPDLNPGLSWNDHTSLTTATWSRPIWSYFSSKFASRNFDAQNAPEMVSQKSASLSSSSSSSSSSSTRNVASAKTVVTRETNNAKRRPLLQHLLF